MSEPIERVEWCGSHYGRNEPPEAGDMVRGVLEAFRRAGGEAVLITDEDAGWVSCADAEALAAWADQTAGAAHSEAEAVRRWWEGYGGGECLEPGEPEPVRGLRAVVRIWVPDADYWA